MRLPGVWAHKGWFHIPTFKFYILFLLLHLYSGKYLCNSSFLLSNVWANYSKITSNMHKSSLANQIWSKKIQMMNWKQKNILCFFFYQIKSTLRTTTKKTFFTVKACSRTFFLHINKEREIGKDMFLVTWKKNWLAIGCFLVPIYLHEIFFLKENLSTLFSLPLPSSLPHTIWRLFHCTYTDTFRN